MARILIVTDDIFTYSGREKVCSYMVDLYSKRNEVDVFSFSYGDNTFHDFSAARNIYSPEADYNAMKYFKDLIKKNGYEYVFIASMGKLSIKLIPVIISLKKIGVKFISCEHVSFNSLNLVVKILKISLLRYYDEIILLTENDKSIYKAWGVKSLVIPNHLIYKKIKKDKRKFVAIAVGRLSDQKNFSRLIDIWMNFLKNDENGWVLKIAGEGELKEELENKIKDYSISDRIILLGKVKNMDALYREADVCLMTSKYEGLPLVLLEAKSYSLPCIALDCKTGPREIISDSKDGYVVNSDSDFINKLNIISNNNEVYFKLSEETQFTSERFDRKEIDIKWLGLLERK